MKDKKYSIILLLFVVMSLFAINTSDAHASSTEEDVKAYGYYQYIYIAETDSIEIVGYIGNEKVAKIPAEIEGKPVKVISNFDDYYDPGDYMDANQKVKEIYIPDGIVEIGGFNFKKNLEKVYIADSVQVIGRDAFNDCNKLKEVKMSANLQEVGAGAFAWCKSLKKIELPYGVKEIKDCTFSECYSLEEINIPDTVTEIGDEAFCFCKKLKKVKLSKNLKVIGDRAFEFCDIRRLDIPKKVTQIGDSAFASNWITKITLHPSVKSIGYEAFAYCPKLKKITIKGTKLKTIKRGAFKKIHSKAVFDVPNKLKKKYKQRLTKSKNFKSKTQKIK